jgi:hypothetical protein
MIILKKHWLTAFTQHVSCDGNSQDCVFEGMSRYLGTPDKWTLPEDYYEDVLEEYGWSLQLTSFEETTLTRLEQHYSTIDSVKKLARDLAGKEADLSEPWSPS